MKKQNHAPAKGKTRKAVTLPQPTNARAPITKKTKAIKVSTPEVPASSGGQPTNKMLLEPIWYNRKQAMKFLNIGKTFLDDLIMEGKLIFSPIGKRSYRFNLTDLHDFMVKLRQTMNGGKVE